MKKPRHKNCVSVWGPIRKKPGTDIVFTPATAKAESIKADLAALADAQNARPMKPPGARRTW